MPPTRVIKVSARTDVRRLVEMIARPDLTVEARARVEALVRAANPHIDSDHVEPGTLVVVPDAPELRADDTIALRAPILTQKDAIAQQLKDLFEQGIAALDQAAVERQATTVILKLRSLRSIESGTTEDSALAKRLLTQVRDRLSAEERAAGRQRQILEEDYKRSLEDLEDLFEPFLVGP